LTHPYPEMKELVSPNVAARSNPGAAARSGRAAPSRRERGSWRRTGEDAGTSGVTASARTPGRSGSRSRFRTPGCRVRSSRLRARPSRTTGGRRTRASPLRTRRRGLLRRLRQEDASWRQPRQGKTHPYYKRRRVFRDGMNACSDGGSRPDHRAEKLEGRTWGFVSDPMKNPHQLRQDLKRMVEWERREPRRDPEREAMAWLEKLARTDRGRRLPGPGGEGPYDPRRARREARRAGGDARGCGARTGGATGPTGPDREAGARQGRGAEHLRQDAPGGPGRVAPEERHGLYRLLRSKVVVRPERDLQASGAVGMGFAQTETAPR
jgi:hypothetical protein